jgi:hypothetical protein
VAALVPQLAAIGGVEAVVLGGSRAQGRARDDSDWDLGLYYRGRLDTAAIRSLGLDGTVVEPGAWGRLVNGGAWLTVDGIRVDLLYRNRDLVDRVVAEADAGDFQVDHVEGYVAGIPSYVLVGELALNRVLVGSLPRPAFPEALRRSAPPRWRGSAAFSLTLADRAEARGDDVWTHGLLARAVLATAHARLAERGVWALNEKGIVARAGLDDAAPAVRAGDTAAVRALLA